MSALRGVTFMSDDPERDIANLARSRLGVEIEPAKMAAFIRENWVRLSLWAHQVHDGTAGGAKEALCK